MCAYGTKEAARAAVKLDGQNLAEVASYINYYRLKPVVWLTLTKQ